MPASDDHERSIPSAVERRIRKLAAIRLIGGAIFAVGLLALLTGAAGFGVSFTFVGAVAYGSAAFLRGVTEEAVARASPKQSKSSPERSYASPEKAEAFIASRRERVAETAGFGCFIQLVGIV